MAGSGGAILRDLIVILVLLVLPPVACVAGVVTLLASTSEGSDVSSTSAVTVAEPVSAGDLQTEPRPVAPTAPEPEPGLEPEPMPEPVAQPEPELAPQAEPPLPIKVRLTRRDVADGVKVGAAGLTRCLRQALARGEVKAGRIRIKLDWTIEPDGSVSDPKLKGPRRLRRTPTAACVETAVEGWHFPASRSGAPIRNYAVPVMVQQ
jgi:hypothetical protein